VGQALPPADPTLLCSTAEGFLTGIPISPTQPSLFVTWRLAGSIPQTRLPQPAGGVPLSAGQVFVALDRKADKAPRLGVDRNSLHSRHIARTGPPYLRHAHPAAKLIMPNHVHVLLLPKNPLPVITRWLKGSTARQANLILGRTGQAFWQDESFDHRVRDEMELDKIVRYVECGLGGGPARLAVVQRAIGRGPAGAWPAEAPAPPRIRAGCHGAWACNRGRLCPDPGCLTGLRPVRLRHRGNRW
jgi:hypothetical protein